MLKNLTFPAGFQLPATASISKIMTFVIKSDKFVRFDLSLFQKLKTMFSKACEYGIKAMIFIAHESESGNRVSLRDIAGAIDSPEAFTAKILQQLRKHRLLTSVKGNTGGFELGQQSSEIMLARIVEAIDGTKIFTGCGLGFAACSEDRPCPIHHKFKKVRDELQGMLETTSLSELSKGLEVGLTFLKQ